VFEARSTDRRRNKQPRVLGFEAREAQPLEPRLTRAETAIHERQELDGLSLRMDATSALPKNASL
jgi:hypothetical protein